MQDSTREVRRPGGKRYVSMIEQSYRKDYVVPFLDYQKNGVISKVLWPSKEQIIRIVPGYDQDTGEVFPQNINVNQYSEEAKYSDYLSDTFQMATIVTGFGSSFQTFITDYKPGSEDERKYGGNTVMHWFIKNIRDSVVSKKVPKFKPIQEWEAWTSLQGTLKFDKKALLMQALLYKTNGEFNSDENGPIVDGDGEPLPLFGVVAVDNKSTIKELMKAFVEPINPGKPLDAINNNRYGGFAEADGIKLFMLPTKSPEGYNMLRPSVQAAAKGWTPTPVPLDEDSIKALWQPWERILHYTTAEEQLKILAADFGADTVNYVIGTDPQFRDLEIPQEIAAAGMGRYKYTNTTPTQRTVISDNPAAKAFGLPKRQPVQPTVEEALTSASVDYTPEQPKRKPTVLPKASSILSPAVRAELDKMRAAGVKTTAPTNSQVDIATELMDDDEQYDIEG